MKFRLILSFFILLIAQEILSQEYIKLLDINRTWKVSYWICGDGPCDGWESLYSIQNDTLINDTLYYELDGYFLREDTAEQIVFRWNGVHEEILYDFKLSKGDTVKNLEGLGDPIIVDSVYEIAINNTLRKCIAFSERDGFNEVWIEGIGSNYGVLTPCFYLSLTDAGYELLCVFEGILPIYGDCSPLEIRQDPFVNQHTPEIKFISSSNSLSIKRLQNSGIILKVFGINGSLRDVFKLSPEVNDVIISLSDYEEGIYIYRAIYEGKFCYGKFMVTK
jgi:hypothetical protein